MRASQSFFFVSISCLAFAVVNIASAGQQNCQSYENKLKLLRIKQKQGNSAKRQQSLKTQEDKAWKKLQLCKRGQLTGKSNTKSKGKKGSKKKKVASKQKNIVAKKHQAIVNKNETRKPLTPLVANNPVVIKSKYQGEQLQAWLNFYQSPKRCRNTKTMQDFVWCAEDKRRQQVIFEQQY